jgi:hypothetical protein
MSYIGRGIDQIDNISTLDNLTFNGSDATFNLTQNSVAFVPVSADALQIQIDGIIQSGNYTCSGSQITFDFVPSSSSVCNGIRHFGVGLLTTVSDGAVTTAKLGADSVNGSKIADNSISDEHLDITAITGQTAITSLADTDKFLVSDASDSGNLKYVEKQYLPSGTLVKVGDVRSNAAAGSHDLTGIFSDTYDKYFFSLSTFPITAGQFLYMQFLDSSNNPLTSGYYGSVYGYDQSGNIVKYNNNGTSAAKLNESTSNGRAWQGQGYIVGPTSGLTSNKGISWQSIFYDGSNVTTTQTGAYANVLSTNATGIRIYSGVNLTAISLQVYGIVDTKHYNGS